MKRGSLFQCHPPITDLEFPVVRNFLDADATLAYTNAIAFSYDSPLAQPIAGITLQTAG